MFDICDAWTLNASLTRSSSYRKCSRPQMRGHSAQRDICAANRRHDEMLAQQPLRRFMRSHMRTEMIPHRDSPRQLRSVTTIPRRPVVLIPLVFPNLVVQRTRHQFGKLAP
jgi:hypothetical protein